MILYKKTKNNTVQTWEGCITNNKITITFGRFNGKSQTTEELITEGKQGRTVLEQCDFILKSLYKSKLNEGYKSIDYINSQRVIYEKDFCFEEELNESIILRSLPEFNEDFNGNYKPMLAQKVNYKKIIYPIYAQPKLNGVRCLIFLKSCKDDGNVKLEDIEAISREGKSYNIATKHIRKALISFFQNNKNLTLDGEIYIHNENLQNISGLVRKQEIDIKHETLQYYVYDLITGETQGKRLLNLKISLSVYKDSKIIKLVNTILLNSENEIKQKHKEFVIKGYEGLMLRNSNGLYEIGKRSINLMKVKEFQEEEFEIVGFSTGKRGSQDLKFELITKEGKKFETMAIGNAELKSNYYKSFMSDYNNKTNLILGKFATVKFFEWTIEGRPFHTNLITIRDYEN